MRLHNLVSCKQSLVELYNVIVIIIGVVQTTNLERRQRTPFNLRKRGISSLIVGGNPGEIFLFINVQYLY